jgi:DNA-binding transcriptional MerR regulator
MGKAKTHRKAIPKSVRFEIFKRDSFKCQYCGASAPEVMLHIDHIEPLSKGGNNDITNLITSCAACNAGKSDKCLDDKSALAKQRIQLEELQERREQLKMLMTWKQGLRDIREDVLCKICDYWNELAPGFVVNDTGKRKLSKWIRKFSLKEIIHAMDIAAEQYLIFDAEEEESVTSESWEKAFSKIPGICRVERESKDNPEIKDLFYIRGIARNRCQYYFDDAEALKLLKIARSWDVPLSELRDIAACSTSWTRFKNQIHEAIERQQQEDDSLEEN